MSDNPLQNLMQAIGNFSNCIQTHLSSFIGQPRNPSTTVTRKPLFSISSSASKVKPSAAADINLGQPQDLLNKGKSAAPVSKEELGRSTWTFLHTLGAQYPENPTRQQKKDVKELMAILSRMYPCKECADHFKDVLRANPVQAGSHAEFSQWLCHVHNVVNRSLGKLVFPCERVDARWGKLECEQRACDLQGTTTDFGLD
ncbi:Flavin-linked sulfhydryl oxidase of the mitochondrial IMS [Turnera subulata]|uniref:Sulfhydryl oxidase n=1 Tax=Turnera subulata TaxID=218843 RepID=A0A9Q0F3Y4_9ROSI|nr:Flavin-linked sulfhydryl oxidase of the mitochondrial IMS [Turnera subulata]